MTVLRCTGKLFKRLRQSPKLPEPVPEANPLGEWYADIEFWQRQACVLMLNGATGAVLVLADNAADLRRLQESALLQFAALCEQHDLRGTGVVAELHGFDAGFSFAPTRDRSLLSSLNQRKFEVSLDFEHDDTSLFDSAARQWNGLFQHPVLGRNPHSNSRYHAPIDLLKQRLS